MRGRLRLSDAQVAALNLSQTWDDAVPEPDNSTRRVETIEKF